MLGYHFRGFVASWFVQDASPATDHLLAGPDFLMVLRDHTNISIHSKKPLMGEYINQSGKSEKNKLPKVIIAKQVEETNDIL